MSVILLHSPGDIIRRIMIALSLGTDPSASLAWPIYAPVEAANPDNIIAVTSTAGRDLGRDMVTSSRLEMFGVQVLVRASTEAVGYLKASAVADALDSLSWDTVTLDGTAYTVKHLIRSSGPISLGYEANSRRWRTSINYLAWILRG
jgi:hypothetical protein